MRDPETDTPQPTDTELLDWLTNERCSLTCWDVAIHDPDDPRAGNGWTVSGAETDEEYPSGQTARDAIAWAMKLHKRGQFKTRTDQLREEND